MLLRVAVAAAGVASVFFAVSAVLEQRSTHQVPERGVFSPRLLLDLARQRLWLASIAATVLGLVFQVVALHFGPLALVQPLLVCDLLFAVLIMATLRHAPPDWAMLAGVVCAASGIGVFLGVAQPRGGSETVSLPAVVPLAIGLGAVLAGCLAWARMGSRLTRSLALALASGVVYGVNAFLLKIVSYSLARGFSEPLEQWPLYALVVLAPVAFLLNQEALQVADLISPALAVITTADPLVSIAIAALWLHESFARGPVGVTLEVASLVVMTAGIVLLARRAPQVVRKRTATDHPAERLSAPPAARTNAARNPASR